MKIGVLALQGGVAEHIHHLKALHCETVEVKRPEELDDLQGIILPGGESTTIGKLLRKTSIFYKLKEKITNGLPVWGTCAGMILLAKNIENDEKAHMQMMDITVKRNAYGSQINSFLTYKKIDGICSEKIPLVFIRAPYITEIGSDVNVLCRVDDNIVAVRQKNMLATSFHPELTDNFQFHKYFIGICEK
ncbi:MAG TPA: pyridoxal 5'-phosphate synthase glutaminase subunit PdxT [Clostridium sp.]|uniref:pyridoxal 5'-phosphate synthase glutaminase subunit PdxT n=1 Tax=uncultured Clostridium sp. TaxID=59620 RepID=UPI000E884479|nr:pyridoxal 5'-phosphate synthase glutaminase subunit PdxT [uncultured Clostridium sp.]NLU09020.1 pyridoxal 5'-phosphate synthase glutaminase subunit PdxT [Clostridiales bacterium]HBC97476.1 pyridoxal 5'-phosphate synthase glutaminase subunit PdxT [Clostridium sp.]